MSEVLAFGFPNPIGWVADKIGGFVEGVATAGFELVIGGLVAWVVDAVVWVVGGVFNFFLDSLDPNVQADWFITGDGPYATTVTIGATLLVGFVLIGITQGVLAGDVGGMLRRIALELPLSVLGMVGLVTITQALIALTDALSGAVLANFQEDIREFTTVVVSLGGLGGGPASAFVVFLLGLVTVLAGMVLVAELAIRAALIYIVVALAPLMFAAQLWPALKGAGRKVLELLCALILSKLVIAIALSVAAAAAVGAGSGGEVTSLAEPEIAAEDPGGSVTQAVGILLAATAAFGVSAFSPLLIAKLLPLTEAALIAQGVRSGPVRAGQQGMSMAYSAKMLGGHRFQQLAAGRTPGGGSTAASGGAASARGAGMTGAAAGGPAGLALAAGTKVGTAAKSTVSSATQTMTGTTGTSGTTGTTATQRPSSTGSPKSAGTTGPSTSGPQPGSTPQATGRNPSPHRAPPSRPAARPPGRSRPTDSSGNNSTAGENDRD